MRGSIPADDRPCRAVLVRHAVAEGQGRFLGQRDAPLSVSGRRQLPGLVAKLAKYDLEAVYCSDLRRA
jgi:broad specificity phosphatase PhoE